jgi:hypothetical protein
MATVIECAFHWRRDCASRRVLDSGPPPLSLPPGRIPRLARLMALAWRLEQLVHKGIVANFAELARLGHVSPGRVSQIMNLRLLAPDIQEQILFLPPTLHGCHPLHLILLQPIARQADWRLQRQAWQRLLAKRPAHA